MPASWKRVLTTADKTTTVSNGSASLPDGNAVYDFVTGLGYTTNTGDITNVIAGTGLSGGGDSGEVTLSVSGLTVSEFSGSAIQTSGESFVDNDTSLMTSAAIQDKILSYGYTTNVGTITGITSGTGLTGGAASGSVTLSVSGLTVNEFAAAAIQTSGEAFANNDTSLMTSAAIEDKILSYGYTTNTGDITSVSTGTNLSGGASSGSVTISLDAALVDMSSINFQFTSAATIDVDAAGGSNASGKDLTFKAGPGTGTGAGGDIIFQTAKPGASGSTPNALATVMTIGDDGTVTINGDLNINGATNTIDVQTLTVEDKTVELANGANSDAAADAAGLIVATSATAANRASFKWLNASVGITGWEIRDSGSSLPQMGVAALNTATSAPTATNFPSGMMIYNNGATSGTAGLYIYTD